MLFERKLTLDQQRLELRRLLAPISAEVPAGANLRLDPEGRDKVRSIESLFRDAITAERKFEESLMFPDSDRAPEPKWGGFLNQADDFLATTSKDLLLATMYAEVGLRELGVRGLLLGLELITGLVETYWPNVFPAQTPEAMKDRRFAAWKQAYDWPERVLPRLERMTTLTASGTTFADLIEATALDDPQLEANARADRMRKGTKTTDAIRGEIRQKEAYFTTLFADLLNCRVALQKLIEVIQQKCTSPDPAILIPVPDFSRVSESIARLIAGVRTITWPGLLPEEADPNAPAPAEGEEGSPTQQAAGVKAPAGQMTREAAFAQLQQLAAFFRRTEPHSPISYAIEQTVRWGNMSLPELFTELIANADSRRTLFERTGLPIKSETE